MTGRRAGYCVGNDMPGYANPVAGYAGRGRALWGGMRGRRWFGAAGMPGRGRYGVAPAWGVPRAGAYGPYAAPLTREGEAEALKSQAEWLRQQLDAISQRITELEQGQ